jgi:hypothetical protein
MTVADDTNVAICLRPFWENPVTMGRVCEWGALLEQRQQHLLYTPREAEAAPSNLPSICSPEKKCLTWQKRAAMARS